MLPDTTEEQSAVSAKHWDTPEEEAQEFCLGVNPPVSTIIFKLIHRIEDLKAELAEAKS